MNYVTKLALIIGAATTLVACGGGGSSDAPPVATNRWAANAGTYTVCNGYWRYAVVFSAAGSNQATITTHSEIYDGNSCTGSIIATLTYPTPVTFTYQSTASVPVSGLGPSPQTLTIDKVQVNIPAMTGTLTGPGVVGNCVYYAGGSSCDSLTVAAQIVDGGLYLTANTLMELNSTASGYATATGTLIKQ